ncbi:MAG: zinc-dependent metalloprotease [Sandaracinaceae bacterium]|nr:zinc-dependent metalloprotease [Sandaracinaceae bacterium]
MARRDVELRHRGAVRVAGRIRWVIDENQLFAYRANEIVTGAADNPDDPSYLGQPLAIFPIEGHVDVRREYNSVTGEPMNVISESSDRRWYDRQFVRVDWSTNLVTWGLFGAGLDIDGLFGQFRREAVANFVQEGGDSRTPDSWRPQFVRIGDDADYRYADEWPAEMADTVHYMSFVTNELWTPMTCFGASCESSLRISIRHAFLRVPPEHEYAVETLPNSEYDRFGIIRTENRTYVRGGRDRSTLGTYCDARCTASCDVLTCTNDGDCGTDGRCQRGECVAGTYENEDQCGTGGRCTHALDAGWGRSLATCSAGTREDADDCGVGTMCTYEPGGGACGQSLDADCGPGLCNLETNTCEGGLTPEYGETDFLTFYRLRHNMFRNSFLRDASGNTIACTGDWQCDARYTGSGATSGSRCDPAAHLCTLPIAQRDPRPVYYHLSAHYPRHLVRSAFETSSQWNETFMRGNRELRGLPMPGEIGCQRDNPSGYCYCPGDDRNPAGPETNDRGACLPEGLAELPRIACQNVDPTQYCYCGSTISAPEVGADMQCAYREDFFVRPEDRPVENAYDCWIGLVQADGTAVPETAAVNPPNPTSFSDYPEDVYRYAFVGSECLWMLKVNSCDVPVAEGEEAASCEELGDIRYQFFNYASGAGAGWCGVMQQVQDPLTGEAVSIPINVGGLCLDRISNNALDLWPVLRGEVDESTLYTGENVRGYFERLGNVHVPVGYAPAVDGAEYSPEDTRRPALPTDLLTQINERMQQLEPRIEQLRASQEGRFAIRSDRLRLLQGTATESRLVEGTALEGPTAIESHNVLTAIDMAQESPRPSPSQLVDQLSPFRDGFRELITADRMREMALIDAYIHYPREALFTSRYNQYWAEAFRGRPNTEAQIRWMQAFHEAVMLHEMGHGLGLEHNFAGSYDRDHYQDGYYALVTQEDPATGDFRYALPEIDDFDCGRDGLCPGDPGYPGPDETENDSTLTGAELTAWADTLRRIRTERAERGIGNYMTSSLMDYNGDLSDMAGLGHYDRAAVFFNYYNMVETFDGNPFFHEGRGTSLEGLIRSDITPRRLWTYYRGGESCSLDGDCPFSSGSGALVPGQRIHQRCVRNPRYSEVPEPCDGDRNCICSNFDEDVVDLAEQAYPGFRPDTWGVCASGDRCRVGSTCADGSACAADGEPDYERVNYMFCSNPRLGDISWCNVFDAGESFQETIDHYRQLWQENYPRSYFRNYRRGFSSGSRAIQYIVDAAKMYQHLFFRYFYEPEFRRETGPLGFLDQYLASIDAMNWLAELSQLPDVGSYRMTLIGGPDGCHPTNPDAPSNPAGCQYGYQHMGEALEMAGSDISLGPGQAFHHWSRYQDGLYGFFRMERAGVFWDKLIALQALTVRDWGLSFTIDERYFINFYDLFPIEMTEVFGGYVIDDPTWIAPRVRMEGGEPHVYYLNYLLGTCRDATTGALAPVTRPSPSASRTRRSSAPATRSCASTQRSSRSPSSRCSTTRRSRAASRCSS